MSYKFVFISFEVECSTLYEAVTKAFPNNGKASNLKDGSFFTGICVGSPSSIEIIFKDAVEITDFIVAGFCGNERIWISSNGSGANIRISTDRINWKLIGSLSTLSGNRITVNTGPIKFKYMRFDGVSYLGISILEFINKL